MHHTYVEDVVLRRALVDIWRAICLTCCWQGPKRYSRADAEDDQRRHATERMAARGRLAAERG